MNGVSVIPKIISLNQASGRRRSGKRVPSHRRGLGCNGGWRGFFFNRPSPPGRRPRASVFNFVNAAARLQRPADVLYVTNNPPHHITVFFVKLLAHVVPLQQPFHVQSIAEQPMRPFIDDIVQANRHEKAARHASASARKTRDGRAVRLQRRRRPRLRKIILLQVRNPKFRRGQQYEALYASSNPTKAWAFRFSTAASTCSSLRYVVFRYPWHPVTMSQVAEISEPGFLRQCCTWGHSSLFAEHFCDDILVLGHPQILLKGVCFLADQCRIELSIVGMDPEARS